MNPHDWPFRAPLFFNPAPHQTYSPQSDFYGQQLLSENESRKQEEEGDDDQPEGQLQDRKIFIGGLPYDVADNEVNLDFIFLKILIFFSW